MGAEVPNHFLDGAGGLSDLLHGVTIGVLYGGPSSEREVSIKSGEAVVAALTAAGHQVAPLLLGRRFGLSDAELLDIDVAFLATHGEFGEDGRLQAVLEKAGIPYIGSDPDASSRAFNKVLAKRAYEAAGVRTPEWIAFDRDELGNGDTRAAMPLQPPLVVKPAASGSSLGVTIVRNLDQVPAAISKAFEFGETALVERFIAGRELTVAVLGDSVLPAIEIRVAPQGNETTYDFSAKYYDDRTEALCPADLPAETAAAVQDLALKAHRALGCRDVSRTDAILDRSGVPWVLETNTLPGLTAHSLLPKAAAAVGLTFAQLCEYLLRRALARLQVKCVAA